MMDAVDDPLYTLGINLCWVSTFPSYSLLYLQSFHPLDASTHIAMLACLRVETGQQKHFPNLLKEKLFFFFFLNLIKYATE